jgi:hypothetical protein
MTVLGRIGNRLAWLLAVVAIGFGGAGLITAMDPGAGGSVSASLAYDGDALVTPGLDQAQADLDALGDPVDAFGTQARGALAATVARDTTTVDAAIAQGDTLLADIITRVTIIQTALGALPYVGDADADAHLSPAVRARYAAIVAALSTLDGLDTDWGRLSVGATAAGHLAAQLAEHDRLVGVAASQGRTAQYVAAIKTLAQAEAVITETKTFRDALSSTVDVGVLDEWLRRNQAYDVALTNLYTAVHGKVTAKVRAAIAAEKVARAQLPPDSRGLVLIMAGVAEGGLNGAVVAIEEAKAALAAATEPAASPAP